MIIELNKQDSNYDIAFAEEYIKRSLEAGAKHVFNEVYSDEDKFRAILPEHIRDAKITTLVNVHFVDEETIEELNREERGISAVTDVLSFPAQDMHNAEFIKLDEFDFYPSDLDGEDSSEEVSEYTDELILDLGDVVICIERAIEQAEEYGHSFTREISFLALHGFLHVIGFDHEESEEAEKQMFAIQEEVLDSLAITRDIEDEAQPVLLEDDKFEFGDGDIDESVLFDLDSIFFKDDSHDNPEFKAGNVAIVGRPNAGKSTLLNRLSGDKLAITSPKAKTTRHNIRVVLDDGESQIVFIDTPGIEKSSNKLERYMASSAWGAFDAADVVLLLVDPKQGRITEVETTAVRRAKDGGIPVILLLTKTDITEKERLLPLILNYSEKFDLEEIIPISATTDDNIDLLLEKIREYLPQQGRLYSEDAYTDQSEKALASEYIREEILNILYQEVPHDVAVEIEKFEEKYNDAGERSLILIDAAILVSRNSQKGIIVGKGGRMIKRIGSNVRKYLEEMYEAKIYLELFVKVRKEWKNEDRVLKDLGYVYGKNGPAEMDIIE